MSEYALEQLISALKTLDENAERRHVELMVALAQLAKGSNPPADAKPTEEQPVGASPADDEMSDYDKWEAERCICPLKDILPQFRAEVAHRRHGWYMEQVRTGAWPPKEEKEAKKEEKESSTVEDSTV